MPETEAVEIEKLIVAKIELHECLNLAVQKIKTMYENTGGKDWDTFYLHDKDLRFIHIHVQKHGIIDMRKV